eukprot:m.314579 g.314579  ORF g.314579 m.314579 type:complete len:1521 (+) comp16494_c4_seq7:96-4658(+)
MESEKKPSEDEQQAADGANSSESQAGSKFDGIQEEIDLVQSLFSDLPRRIEIVSTWVVQGAPSDKDKQTEIEDWVDDLLRKIEKIVKARMLMLLKRKLGYAGYDQIVNTATSIAMSYFSTPALRKKIMHLINIAQGDDLLLLESPLEIERRVYYDTNHEADSSLLEWLPVLADIVSDMGTSKKKQIPKHLLHTLLRYPERVYLCLRAVFSVAKQNKMDIRDAAVQARICAMALPQIIDGLNSLTTSAPIKQAPDKLDTVLDNILKSSKFMGGVVDNSVLTGAIFTVQATQLAVSGTSTYLRHSQLNKEWRKLRNEIVQRFEYDMQPRPHLLSSHTFTVIMVFLLLYIAPTVFGLYRDVSQMGTIVNAIDSVLIFMENGFLYYFITVAILITLSLGGAYSFVFLGLQAASWVLQRHFSIAVSIFFLIRRFTMWKFGFAAATHFSRLAHIVICDSKYDLVDCPSELAPNAFKQSIWTHVILFILALAGAIGDLKLTFMTKMAPLLVIAAMYWVSFTRSFITTPSSELLAPSDIADVAIITVSEATDTLTLSIAIVNALQLLGMHGVEMVLRHLQNCPHRSQSGSSKWSPCWDMIRRFSDLALNEVFAFTQEFAKENSKPFQWLEAVTPGQIFCDILRILTRTKITVIGIIAGVLQMHSTLFIRTGFYCVVVVYVCVRFVLEKHVAARAESRWSLLIRDISLEASEHYEKFRTSQVWSLVCQWLQPRPVFKVTAGDNRLVPELIVCFDEPWVPGAKKYNIEYRLSKPPKPENGKWQIVATSLTWKDFIRGCRKVTIKQVNWATYYDVRVGVTEQWTNEFWAEQGISLKCSTGPRFSMEKEPSSISLKLECGQDVASDFEVDYKVKTSFTWSTLPIAEDGSCNLTHLRPGSIYLVRVRHKSREKCTPVREIELPVPRTVDREFAIFTANPESDTSIIVSLKTFKGQDKGVTLNEITSSLIIEYSKRVADTYVLESWESWKKTAFDDDGECIIEGLSANTVYRLQVRGKDKPVVTPYKDVRTFKRKDESVPFTVHACQNNSVVVTLDKEDLPPSSYVVEFKGKSLLSYALSSWLTHRFDANGECKLTALSPESLLDVRIRSKITGTVSKITQIKTWPDAEKGLLPFYVSDVLKNTATIVLGSDCQENPNKLLSFPHEGLVIQYRMERFVNGLYLQSLGAEQWQEHKVLSRVCEISNLKLGYGYSVQLKNTETGAITRTQSFAVPKSELREEQGETKLPSQDKDLPAQRDKHKELDTKLDENIAVPSKGKSALGSMVGTSLGYSVAAIGSTANVMGHSIGSTVETVGSFGKYFQRKKGAGNGESGSRDVVKDEALSNTEQADTPNTASEEIVKLHDLKATQELKESREYNNPEVANETSDSSTTNLEKDNEIEEPKEGEGENNMQSKSGQKASKVSWMGSAVYGSVKGMATPLRSLSSVSQYITPARQTPREVVEHDGPDGKETSSTPDSDEVTSSKNSARTLGSYVNRAMSATPLRSVLMSGNRGRPKKKTQEELDFDEAMAASF